MSGGLPTRQNLCDPFLTHHSIKNERKSNIGVTSFRLKPLLKTSKSIADNPTSSPTTIKTPLISRLAQESPPNNAVSSQSALRRSTNPLPITSLPTNSSNCALSEAANSQSAPCCYTNPLQATSSSTNRSGLRSMNAPAEPSIKASLKQKRARFLEHSRSVTAALRSLRSRSLSSSHDPVNVTQHEPDQSPLATHRSPSPSLETVLAASPRSTASSDSQSTQLSSCSSHRRLQLASLVSPAREATGAWRSFPAPYSSALSTPITPFTESPLVTSERLQQERKTEMLTPRRPTTECGVTLPLSPSDGSCSNFTLVCSDASCLYNTQTLTDSDNASESRCLCGSRMVVSQGDLPAECSTIKQPQQDETKAETKHDLLAKSRVRQKMMPAYNSCASSLSGMQEEDTAVVIVSDSAPRLSTSRQSSSESTMVATV